MKFTAIIVDDEITAIEALKQEIRLFTPQIRVESFATSIEEGIEMIKKYQPLILFLDIQLHERLGFELAEKIDKDQLYLIFTTAYADYAIEAIKNKAFDYLLKPVNGLELTKTIERIEEDCKTNFGKNKLLVADRKGLKMVDLYEVTHFKAEGNYTYIFLEPKKKILISKNLMSFEKLQKEAFFRIHKSVIVNLSFIELYSYKASTVLLKNGEKLQVAQRKRKELSEKLKGFGADLQG